MICTFILKRGSRKGQVCNVKLDGLRHKKFCKDHLPISLDAQPYFDDFLAWCTEEFLEKYNYNRQFFLYRQYMKIVKSLSLLQRLLEIEDPNDKDKTLKQLKHNYYNGNQEYVTEYINKLSVKPCDIIKQMKPIYQLGIDFDFEFDNEQHQNQTDC